MTQVYKDIFEFNKKWIAEKLAIDPNFFEKMSAEQKPEFLFIGCSDSRIDPDVITGLDIGKLFVHRNIANIVNPIDLNATSVIEYSIENLNVKHIVICGHYECGGIQAAMTKEGIGKNSPWLQIIKDIYRIYQGELDAIEDEQKRYDRLVELNVLEQCQNVIEMESVKKQYIAKKYPIVYGWIFDVRTGKIIDLNFDYQKGFEDLSPSKTSSINKVYSKFKNILKR